MYQEAYNLLNIANTNNGHGSTGGMSDGTYTLKATVNNGNVTITWVKD